LADLGVGFVDLVQQEHGIGAAIKEAVVLGGC
jgi:hypothetical protein